MRREAAAELTKLLRSWEARRPSPVAAQIIEEQFEAQRAFNADRARLCAALCGRRSGKTRGRNRSILSRAMQTRGGRFLVINETADQVRKLNWIGVQGDGIATTIQALKIDAHVDNTRMVVHFRDADSWISCLGVDDETSIGKALGGGFHEVWWDEAQKIPARWQQRIRETFLPTLLDFGGRLVLTGSPSRQMSGLFYEVTRPDVAKRLRGWSVHQWNLLANPHFGRAVPHRDGWAVVDKRGQVVAVANDNAEAQQLAEALRFRDGLQDLQGLLGGPDVAPLDGPIMQREGFGRWVAEDSAFVYAFHRAKPGSLFWDQISRRPDGFPDFAKQLARLPGWGSIDYYTALGADLGFSPDPFAISVVAWSLRDPCLYELGTWKATNLDSEQQAAILREVRELVRPGVAVADAGGGGRPVVAGWEREWISRYGIPIVPAEKANKHLAIEQVNTDILTQHDGRPRLRLLEGSPLAEEYAQIQWASVRSITGKLTEDPTIPNDCADAFLYAHRHSWHHRYRPEQPADPPTLRIERELEQAAFDDDLTPVLAVGSW